MVLNMKNLIKIYSTAFVLSFIVYSAGAQNALLRYADKQFDLENYSHSVEVYEEAFEKKESYQTAKK
jgi:hypothetical protein